MIQASPPSLFTLTIVYLSSFSGVNFPSLIPHHRPDNVALVMVALNVASNSSWVSFGFGVLAAGLSFGGAVSCAANGLAKVSTNRTSTAIEVNSPDFMASNMTIVVGAWFQGFVEASARIRIGPWEKDTKDVPAGTWFRSSIPLADRGSVSRSAPEPLAALGQLDDARATAPAAGQRLALPSNSARQNALARARRRTYHDFP